MGKIWGKFLEAELEILQNARTHTQALTHNHAITSSYERAVRLRCDKPQFTYFKKSILWHFQHALYTQFWCRFFTIILQAFSDKWLWSLARIFIIVFERHMLTSSNRSASLQTVCKSIKKFILDFCKMCSIIETVDQTVDYFRFHGLTKFLIVIPIYCHLVPILRQKCHIL